ncbi:MAG: hypothetical protein II278_01520, partial [Bacteroidaceae bacterium]|nr:hypothetical protein [Bacteroidaceae bacterium]
GREIKKWLEKAVGRKGSNQEARGGCLAALEKGVLDAAKKSGVGLAAVKKGGVQLCMRLQEKEERMGFSSFYM